uniref:HIV Tat-specific factor 1 homolog (Trinotate prediction) n=1 Tax=Myxobolus squamalis TaxID=59785 RepID=A0A6B2FY90_MYXSQ
MENQNLEPWEQYLRDNEEKADSKIKTKTDPKDGTVYEWNEKNHGWFPKVNEDFIAQYQASYGFAEDLKPIESIPNPPKCSVESHPKCRKAKKEKNIEVKKEPGLIRGLKTVRMV